MNQLEKVGYVQSVGTLSYLVQECSRSCPANGCSEAFVDIGILTMIFDRETFGICELRQVPERGIELDQSFNGRGDFCLGDRFSNLREVSI